MCDLNELLSFGTTQYGNYCTWPLFLPAQDRTGNEMPPEP